MFRIYDLLLSDKNPNIVTLYIRKLQQKYGSRDDLTFTKSKVHEYLGIILDLRVKLEVQFCQYNFLKIVFNSLPKRMQVGLKYTAAPKYLIKTTDNSCVLGHTRKGEFHTITAKILWLSQQMRLYVQLSVGFCCTRIQVSTYHHWKKLTHLLSHL